MFYKNLLIFTTVLLCGCGFTPMNKLSDNSNMTAVTEKIIVGNIPNYEGFLLKTELQHQLNPKNATQQKDYFLAVSLRSPFYEDQTIQGDNFASRETVSLKASFQLKDQKTGKVLLSDSTTATGAYNIVREPYSTHMARNKLQQNLIRVVSNNITLRVISFLKSQEERNESQITAN